MRRQKMRHLKMHPKETQAPFQRYAKAHILDFSLWAIIGGNVVSLVLAIAQQWNLNDIMWLYWSQSVVIGGLNFFRMWHLKNFTTGGMLMNGKPVAATASGARATAIFFALHFGLFHFVYGVFLIAGAGGSAAPGGSDVFISVLFCAVLFLVSHVFSLIQNARDDLGSPTPNLGTMMFMPYLRVIPMHLTIIFGSFAMGGGTINTGGIVLFMGLKTFADVLSHLIEHFIYQKSKPI